MKSVEFKMSRKNKQERWKQKEKTPRLPRWPLYLLAPALGFAILHSALTRNSEDIIIPATTTTIPQIIDHNPENPPEKDPWSFLQEPISYKATSEKEILDNLVPVGPIGSIERGSTSYLKLRTTIWPEVARHIREGNLKSGKMDMTATFQHYVIPSDLRKAKATIEYSKLAESFMYEQLPGLDKFNIKWTTVGGDETENYTKDFHSRAFIGEGIVTLKLATVFNIDEPGNTQEIPVSSCSTGARSDTRIHKGAEDYDF
ncbi:MAG: hypothetical protein QF915_01995 [Candidatus Woesearchaeota archaeon]|nr:hypothetical protein [Candidatus Woesearchaeota archaeon]